MWAASCSKTLPKARYYIRSVRYCRILIDMLQNNDIIDIYMFEQVGKASMNARFSMRGSRHGLSHIYFLYFFNSVQFYARIMP